MYENNSYLKIEVACNTLVLVFMLYTFAVKRPHVICQQNVI